MKKFWFGMLVPAVVLLLAVSCGREEKPVRRWYKGNLHTHSYWSDGDEFPEVIIDWYKERGYDFVALSDHNVLAQGDKWVLVPKSRMYEDGFENYLAKFGDDWVTYKRDTGRIHVKLKTFEEYVPRFASDSFLIIRAEEITDKFQDKPIHINVANVQELISPAGGEHVVDVMQRNIDAVLQQRQQTGVPMFPHINHPNFYYAITADDMIQLTGERFFEVYNGHPLVNNGGDSAHLSTEQMWDRINIAYAERGQPLMYGLATDDSHHYHQFGRSFSNAGRGWIMVESDSLQPEHLITAMEDGRFYASTGVVLKTITSDNGRISLEVLPEAGVRYLITFVGVRKGESRPEVVKMVNGIRGEFELTDDFVFVRAKVTSDKPMENPVLGDEVEMAWTQPVQQ